MSAIAVSCHTPQWHENEDAFRDVLRARVADAQCSLLVFAEYSAMEAALIGSAADTDDPIYWAERGAGAQELWVETLREAARAEGCYILAGSGPATNGAGIVNRSVFIAPDGSVGHQDKMIPTPWERRWMKLSAGEALTLFHTSLGKIGVLICYDAEFPLYARALAAAGAEILLVPACTDTQDGQDRVQIASRARALENQCLVVHAPLIGAVPSCDPIDINVGQAGFFGPPDWGQPDGGIHALAHPDTKAWCRAVPDLASILRSRKDGQVELFSDWARQSVSDLPVHHVVLGN